MKEEGMFQVFFYFSELKFLYLHQKQTFPYVWDIGTLF